MGFTNGRYGNVPDLLLLVSSHHGGKKDSYSSRRRDGAKYGIRRDTKMTGERRKERKRGGEEGWSEDKALVQVHDISE